MSVTAELADGRRLEFPDGTAPAVVQATVKKVLGLSVENKAVPDGQPAEQPKDTRSGIERVDAQRTGRMEAAGAMLSSATTGLLGRLGGTIGGIAGSIATGKYGTQEGAQMAAQTAEEGARKLTYEPKTDEGKEALETISRLFDASKLGGLGPSEVVAAGNVRAAPVRPVVGHAARVVRQEARDLKARIAPGEPEMAGGGSAMTAEETMRRQRAASLPVPIDLTKGQATREFAQQQFERETAKDAKTGDPLRRRFAEQNERILQNFDAWIDQTGAESGSLRVTGQAVDKVIVDKANKAKTEIRSAYKAARESGDMQERIAIAPLAEYLDENEAAAINAPVLSSVKAQLGKVADKAGTVSLNDLEEVRKMVGKLSGKDATNATFGKEVKGVIDGLTEGKGGELYKKARALRYQYAQDFEDHAIVDKLLSKKPGTKDRAVAYEDVFDHSILKGSLDDVRTIRKTLQTAGPEGEQAWKELQGETIKHIKDEITKSSQLDQAGNRVISPARLDRLVRDLDSDGKLDFLFGKQGAQQIRDVNGISMDAFTSPAGAVNHSNTASRLAQVLDTLAGKITGVPFAGSTVNWAAREVRNAGTRKRVQDALK